MGLLPLQPEQLLSQSKISAHFVSELNPTPHFKILKKREIWIIFFSFRSEELY